MTMITPSYLGETIEYSSLHACRSTLEDPTYSIPKEGAVMWFDFMAVPKDAPHPDAAHAFINYILDPKVIGPITNEVYYANPNLKSKPFVDKEILEDKNVYPDAAMMKRLFPEISPTQEIERLRTRLWTRVKTGT